MPKKPPKKFGPTREEVIEQLAKIAVRSAGMKEDSPLRLARGDEVIYDGPAWQEPDMLAKAEAAWDILRWKPERGR